MTAPLFSSRRLGKWGKEEEDYAARLIQEFEWGCVPDCTNGTTLRAFLAVQLYCAPMRISKKYAGKAIGKHVFMRTDENDRRAKKLKPSLKQLKFDFIAACYKKMDKEMPPEVAEEYAPSKMEEGDDDVDEEKPVKGENGEPDKDNEISPFNRFYRYDPVSIADSSTNHYAPFGLDSHRVPYSSAGECLNDLYSNFKSARESNAILLGPEESGLQYQTQVQASAYIQLQPEHQPQPQTQPQPPSLPTTLQPTTLRQSTTRQPQRQEQASPPTLQPLYGSASSSDFQQWLRSQPHETISQFYQPSTATGTARLLPEHLREAPPFDHQLAPAAVIHPTASSSPSTDSDALSTRANNNTLKKVTKTLVNYSAIASTVKSYVSGNSNYGVTAEPKAQSSQVTANTLKIHQKQQNKSSKDPNTKAAPTNYTHPALKPIGSRFAGDSKTSMPATTSSVNKISRSNDKSLVSTTSSSMSSDNRSEDSAADSPSPTTTTNAPAKKKHSKTSLISDDSEQSNSCTDSNADSNSDNNSDQGSSDRSNSSKSSESENGSSEHDSNSEHGSNDGAGSGGDGTAASGMSTLATATALASSNKRASTDTSTGTQPNRKKAKQQLITKRQGNSKVEGEKSGGTKSQ